MLKKLWNALTTVLVTLVVILAMLLAAPRLVGLQPFAVLSGSMEPTYQTGSVIYVKKADPAELSSGDVITYLISEETVVTHRITEVVPDADGMLRFRTKGDANEIADATLVHEANVLGTPVFTIPYLGRLAAYLQTKAGMYRTISVAALIALLVILPDLLAKTPKPEQ